ncbi:MAG: hypothetical protein GYB65_15620 [Chloroflexi bacterium]|nr:hypothetical protein [Chloroflexota bacterium]
MDFHDPGDNYNGPDPSRRRRRSYRRESEYDDVWAGADEAADFDDEITPAALAAGSTWEDRDRLGVYVDDDDVSAIPDTHDLGPLPASAERLRGRRPTASRTDRIRMRYDREHTYSQSPSYRRSQDNVFERTLGRITGDRAYDRRKRDPNYSPGPLSQFPFWSIVLLVLLAITAVGVTALACASVLTVF